MLNEYTYLVPLLAIVNSNRKECVGYNKKPRKNHMYIILYINYRIPRSIK